MNAAKLPRFARLLPVVVLASAALLVLNGTGLVHDAAALAQTLGAPDAPAASKDFAGSDDQIASAAQADILTSMSRRRGELDTRQASIQMQADILAATEQRVDAKIAQLKTLQDNITGLLQQRDDAQKAQIASLVKTYSLMGDNKPASAARIFETMPDSVLVPVAQLIKSDIMAKILGAMNPDAAQKLTVKLADKLTLPQTADAAAPAAPAAVTPPGPAAAPAAAQKQP